QCPPTTLPSPVLGNNNSNGHTSNSSSSTAAESASVRALQRELADSIIRRAPLDELRILLACGAKVNEPVTQGLRPLHYATYQKYEKAVGLLLVRGCDVNAMDDVGYTALHLCAERGYAELMVTLIEHSAQVKFTQLKPDERVWQLGNPPRNTIVDEPLRLAIKNGHLECAEILLKHGADPNARYFLGSEINLISPLNVLCLEMLLKFGAFSGRPRPGYAAAKILIHYGADVNAITSERHDYRSVLHYAVLSNNIDIVRLLLHHGANARYIFPTPAIQKPTPLDFALLSGNVEMVKLLINAGADVNVGSPIIGRPLHIVLSEKTPNKAELVDLLLDAGADPNAITTDNRGPLLKPPIGEYFNATEQPRADIVRKLLKYGAQIVIKAQVHNQIGILKVLNRLEVEKDAEVIDLVLEATESFNIAGIKRCTLLSEALRERILAIATKPQPLFHQCRLLVRKVLTELALKSQAKMVQKAVRQINCPLYSKRRPYKKRKLNSEQNQSPNIILPSAADTLATGYDSDDDDLELLDGVTIERLNRMTNDEIEDEFHQSGNSDPERMRLLTYLLQRTSKAPSTALVPGAEVIERIEQLPLPDIVKDYLLYQLSFRSVVDLMNSAVPLDKSTNSAAAD
ncbi:hypothetical protein TYRP_015719, partial [Tyrophagus putrescentiae]